MNYMGSAIDEECANEKNTMQIVYVIVISDLWVLALAKVKSRADGSVLHQMSHVTVRSDKLGIT